MCLAAALVGLLFGDDTAVIAGAIGFLQSHFHLDLAMKGWAASSALLGCVLGVSFAGILSDRAGRKKTLLFSACLFLGSAIGTALAGSFTHFVLTRILGGVGIGIASMASPMYIAEITPARIRGRMVSVNQFAIISGMLVIYFVNYFVARHGDEAWNAATGASPFVGRFGCHAAVPLHAFATYSQSGTPFRILHAQSALPGLIPKSMCSLFARMRYLSNCFFYIPTFCSFEGVV